MKTQTLLRPNSCSLPVAFTLPISVYQFIMVQTVK